MIKHSRLLGAMVGLARASEGNFDKLTQDTACLMMSALYASFMGSDAEANEITEKIKAEKYRIVPDCATCKSPCGRTFDYDFALLQKDDKNTQAVKKLFIYAMQGLSVFCKNTDILPNDDYLYKAVYCFGAKDFPIDVLLENLFEINEWGIKSIISAKDSDAILNDVQNGEFLQDGKIIELNGVLKNYYTALRLAMTKDTKKEIHVSISNPLHVLFMLTVCQSGENCDIYIKNADFRDELSEYLYENYNIKAE